MFWLDRLTRGLLFGGLLLLFLSGGWFLLRSEPVVPSPKQPIKISLPVPSFAQPVASYDQTGFSLRYVEPSIQLPDLRQEVVYYGLNERPDAQGKGSLLIGLKGSPEGRSVNAGAALYLTGRSFSPDNSPTELWISLQPKGKGMVEVSVQMVDEAGSSITTPQSLARFTLQERDFSKMGGIWSIGVHRADSSLLARQRARWVGKDLFLETHGGEEYKAAQGKQKIDFGEGDATYACFVSEGDSLVWTGSRWEIQPLGSATMGKPLLIVQKLDQRSMHLMLWDSDGKARQPLTLLQQPAPTTGQSSFARGELDFKFLGVETWDRFIVEVHGQRMLLRPGDWLLRTATGWEQVMTVEQLDDYVQGRRMGDLFILDGLDQQEGPQQIQGHLFNSARTEMKALAFGLQRLPVVQPPTGPPEALRPIALSRSAETPPTPPDSEVLERVKRDIEALAEDDEDR